MNTYHTADCIFPVHTKPIPKGVVEVSDEGEILGIYNSVQDISPTKTIHKHKGFITPGFVNAHCHLELSHLVGAVSKHSGLVSFVQSVIKLRGAKEDEVTAAMKKADKQMQKNGIVAVGDITNSRISASIKKNSPIAYHTFVELLCFEPDKARESFDRALKVCGDFDEPSSITPHAPYSVCKEIYRYLKQLNHPQKNLISIHNQETEDENKFFRYKTGAFVEFYKALQMDIEFFKAQGRNSLQSVLPLLPKDHPSLFVHNTYTSIKDLYFANRHDHQITWCFCPNANLYIENRLPKIKMFWEMGYDITLGTDSLASNSELCLLAEMKTVRQHFEQIPFEDILRWATLNGAKFYRMDKKLGSLEVGKRPGLNLISHVNGNDITNRSTVTALI